MTQDSGPCASVTFALDAHEMASAGRAAWREMRRLTLLMYLLVALTALVIVPMLYALGGAGVATPVAAMSVTFIVLMLAGSFMFPWLTERVIARRFPEQVGRTTTITLDDAGIQGETVGGRWERQWDAASGWFEEKGFIFVRHGRATVVIVPTRAFDSAAHEEAFLAVLRAHLPEMPEAPWWRPLKARRGEAARRDYSRSHGAVRPMVAGRQASRRPTRPTTLPDRPARADARLRVRFRETSRWPVYRSHSSARSSCATRRSPRTGAARGTRGRGSAGAICASAERLPSAVSPGGRTTAVAGS